MNEPTLPTRVAEVGPLAKSCRAIQPWLDDYSAGTLRSESRIVQLECHILECQACQQLLMESDQVTNVMLLALVDLQPELPAQNHPSRLTPRMYQASLPFALLLLMSLLTGWAWTQSTKKTVHDEVLNTKLIATRAQSSPQFAPATSLNLELDVEGLTSLPKYTVQLYSMDGMLFKSAVQLGNPVLHLPAGLPQGQYTIQLLAPDSKLLLREFMISVASK